MVGSMNIDELMILAERSRTAIEKIDDDFYERLKERIAELEERMKKASDEDATRIEDEIRTLKKIQKKIFEARTGKIIRLAWAEVCNTESGIEGKENLIQVEKDFLEKLKELILKFRELLLEKRVEKEESIEEGDYVLLRIKQDIPEFEGVDGKTYKLRREDVVLIPKLNANGLIKSGVAEKIEVKR